MPWFQMRRTPLYVLSLAFSLFAPLAVGQVASAPAAKPGKLQEKTFGPITGIVIEPAGKPVAGATVWLSGRSDYTEDSRVVEKTTTDEKGQFKFGVVDWDVPSERARSPELTARDSQGRIGAMVRHYRPTTQPAANPFENIQIKLQEVKEYRGKLTDTAGQPIAKATVRPNIWTYMHEEEGRRTQDVLFFSAELSHALAAETGADGSFLLRSMPQLGRIDLRIETREFGKPRASLNLEKAGMIPIGRPGSIRGSLTCDRDSKAGAGITLRLLLSRAGHLQNRSDCEVYYLANAVTQADGAFAFDGVPPAKYTIEPAIPEDSPYYVDNLSPVDVISAETATVSFSLKPAVKVQGKVVDGQTGAGVPGIRVNAYSQDGRSDGRGRSPATTDAQGTFVLYLRPGRAQLNIWQLPDQYARPGGVQGTISIEAEKDTTLDPIRLERAAVLEGLVVDKSGKPVPDARIYGHALDMGSSFFPDQNIRSDRNGKFILKGVSPKMRLSIRARTKTAATEPANVTPADLKEPLHLVADEKTAFAVRGTLVDEVGRPVPKAEVGLTINLWFGNHGIGFRGDSCTTDTDGKFAFGGLWAGDKYDVLASAQGFEKRASPQIKGTPGGIHDFGKLVLAAVNGTVEGKVLDSSGKPVADARVFNSGDGEKLLEARTDDAGTFRLVGFRKGPVYVFAEKDGYRFVGLKTAAGDSNAVVKMLRSDEPPRLYPAPTAIDSQIVQQSARKLLTLLSTTGDTYVKNKAAARLAEMDAKQTVKKDEQQTPKKPDPPKENDINRVADEDVEEALTLVPQDQNQAYRTLTDLAQRFAASDREKALKFVSEAIIRARNLDDPDRTLRLAELGVLASRLENKEVGEKLVREAAELAAKWTVTEQREWQMASLAKTIAPLDLASALGLSQKIKKERRSSCLANLAVTLDDLDKAESVLQNIEPWYASRARSRLAYRIAAARPADAIRLVENIPNDNGREDFSKAAAFGWLATAIAPKDSRLAHSLVDRAFAIHLHPSDRSNYAGGGRPAQAALLAYQARMIGYPDMESVVYRTLAARQTTKDSWSPVAAQESSVMMAIFLALVDRSLAKQVLQAIEPNSAVIGSGGSGVGNRDWLKAWALVEPPHAVELFERALFAAKDENAKRSLWYEGLEMIDLWNSDPGDMLKLLTRNASNVFSPDQDF